MTTLRERFQNLAHRDTVVIRWEDEPTIEDIIYISKYQSKARLDMRFGHYIDSSGPDVDLECDVFRIRKNLRNIDRKLLLYVVMRGTQFQRSLITYDFVEGSDESDDDGDDYEFQPGFLKECWDLACHHEVEHQRFGTALKNLGFSVEQDSSEFDRFYLNPRIKYQRSSHS